MGRRRLTIFGLAAAATIALIAGTLLLFPGSAPAQKAPAVAVELPPGYAGAETCKGCHEEVYDRNREQDCPGEVHQLVVAKARESAANPNVDK